MVPGVFLGSFIAAWFARELKLEGFQGGHAMRRYIIGAVLMGFGGMLAGGCAVGAGVSGAAVFAITAWVTLTAMWIGASLTDWLTDHAKAVEAETGVRIEMRVQISGESFLTPPGDLSALIADAVEAELGRRPEFSTSGGTSDARFVKDHCPVVEFGLVGKTMHQVDERIEIVQIQQLKAIYGRILRDYFA